MESYIIKIKELDKNNNLVYTIEVECTYTIYRINKDRGYHSISNILRDNRFKHIVSSYLSTRY
jgi:hypothetical protein